jgi:hypothetical protein
LCLHGSWVSSLGGAWAGLNKQRERERAEKKTPRGTGQHGWRILSFQ